jgi:ankyrin repeat protein
MRIDFGLTNLHHICATGDLELAKLLLEKGAGPGATNARGTPLHNAAARAHPEVVALLLKRGADVCPAGSECPIAFFPFGAYIQHHNF